MEMNVNIKSPSEGISTGCLVKSLGDSKYRLLEHPTMAECAKYGDVIEADLGIGSEIIFKNMIERSKLKMFDRLLPMKFVESQGFENLKAELNEANIFWQQDLGGLFHCFLPLDSDLDIEKRIQELMAAAS